MEVSGQAIVLTNGLFDTKSAKTAHGLIRASKRFEVVAIIDKKFYGKFVSIDTNQKITVTEKPSSITIHKDVQSFLKFNQTRRGFGEKESCVSPNYCIIGVASAGGLLPEEMREDILLAMKNSMSIINGLHSMLSEDKDLASSAKTHNVKIHDVRK